MKERKVFLTNLARTTKTGRKKRMFILTIQKNQLDMDHKPKYES